MKKVQLLIAVFSLLLFGACESETSFDSGEIGNISTGQGGSLARFTIANGHLFAVNGTNLKAFDISDRKNPVFKMETNLNVNVETIFARDASTIFIGTQQGMFIYDVSNAPKLDYLSDYEHVVSCDPVVANQKYAYVTLHTDLNSGGRCFRGQNQLDVVDISTLNNIRVVNTIPMDSPKGLGLYGDTLFVCDNGLKIFDISNGKNPVQISYKKNIEAVDIIPRNSLMIISTTTGIEQYRYKSGNLNFLSRI